MGRWVEGTGKGESEWRGKRVWLGREHWMGVGELEGMILFKETRGGWCKNIVRIRAQVTKAPMQSTDILELTTSKKMS
jgi:hypothetical protein